MSADEEPRIWLPDEVLALGVRTDVGTAGSILGLSRTQAYEAVNAGRFPVETFRIGRRIVVPTAPIIRLLGLAPPLPPAPPPPPARAPQPATDLNPGAGTIYRRGLYARPGECERCDVEGQRVVDHCHEHGIVRGLICHRCNSLKDANMGDYVRNCQFCEYELDWKGLVFR